MFTYRATAQAAPRGDGPPRPSPSTWSFTPNEFLAVKTGCAANGSPQNEEVRRAPPAPPVPAKKAEERGSNGAQKRTVNIS